MSFPKKFLTPVLALSTLFCAAAVGQQKPDLPSAPSATVPAVVQPGTPRDSAAKIDLRSYLKPDYLNQKYVAPGFNWSAPPKSTSSDQKLPIVGDGRIGKLAGYVDQHSNGSQLPFDFAMEYRLNSRFGIQAGTLVNMAARSGQYEADRFMLRQMTGMPDWETISLRNAMFGQPPGNPNNVNNGYGVGLKIYLGHKK